MKFRSIKRKLISFAAIILAISLAMFCLFGAIIVAVGSQKRFAETKKGIESALVGKGTTLTANNSIALRTMAEENAYSAIREIVASTVRFGVDISYGIYMDNDCLPWVTASPENPQGTTAGTRLLTDPISLWARDLKAPGHRLIASGGGPSPVMEFAAPVLGRDGQKLGTIRYGISTRQMIKSIDEEKRSAVRTATSFTAAYIIIALCVFLLGLYIARRHADAITRPVELLSKAATAITEGNYSLPVSTVSDDEIGTLAGQFEKMRNTMKNYTENLESEVERRTAEIRTIMANLSEMKDRAEAATKAKSEFLSNMSHEIRTPVNAMIGFGELLKNTALDDRQRDYVETMCASGEHLMSLIDDILDISKIESRKIVLEEIDFDLERLIGSVLKILRQRTSGKTIDLNLVYPGNVPRYYAGDPTRIRQIFVNMVGNSIKFTDEGNVTVSVGMTGGGNGGTSAGPALLISIKDTGIGIPQDMQDAIFDAFTQVDSSITRQYGGSGLGLTITKSLIAMMGGNITVRSVPGKGTEFVFTLCLMPGKNIAQAVSGDGRGKERQAVLPGGGGASIQGVQVLVVEDNAINRKLMGILLRQMGCVSEMSDNGRDAVEKVRSHAYDVILMDIQMPVMDGYQAARTIRTELGAKTPIIALTAHVFQEEQQKCKDAGMDDFLAKPVEIMALREKILAWAGKARGPAI